MILSPMTPPNCDLRTFPYMPIYIDRFLGSDFFTQARDGEFRVGLVLYLKAFREVPAGSLPNDDRALARLAELGQDVPKMKRVRAVALRGWVLCSDGRLYHPVVAEITLQAWIERLKARKKSMLGNAKRWGGESTMEDVDDQIAAACCCLFLVKADASPSGIAPGILERSHRDAKTILQGIPRGYPTGIAMGIASLEATPSGYPSQEIESGEVGVTRVSTHTREHTGTHEGDDVWRHPDDRRLPQ